MLHQLKNNIYWCLKIRLTRACMIESVRILRLKIIPSIPERTHILQSHFLGFWGLYCLRWDIPLNRTICSSIHSFSDGMIWENFFEMIYKRAQFIKLIFTIWWALQVVIAVEITFYEFKTIDCHYLGNFFKIKFTVPI